MQILFDRHVVRYKKVYNHKTNHYTKTMKK